MPTSSVAHIMDWTWGRGWQFIVRPTSCEENLAFSFLVGEGTRRKTGDQRPGTYLDGIRNPL